VGRKWPTAVYILQIGVKFLANCNINGYLVITVGRKWPTAVYILQIGVTLDPWYSPTCRALALPQVDLPA